MVYIVGLVVGFVFLTWFGWAWWRNILERKSPEHLFVLANKAMLSGREDLGIQAFRRAAERGHGLSQVQIGMMYYHGKFYEQNRALAAEWLEKAASQGVPNAQQNLGVMFLKGEGVPVDHQQARKWFERAAAQGITQAQQRLAAMDAAHSDAKAADADASGSIGPPTVVSSTKARVHDVVPTALFMDYRMERHLKIFEIPENLGSNGSYLSALGLTDDSNRSQGMEKKVFERVCNYAKNGNPSTEALAGVLTFNRSTTGVGRAAAHRLLSRAAASGHLHAQYLLTRVWPEPDRPPMGGGALWEAAKQGDVHAQYELGGRYRRGEGFEEAITLSTQWYQKAAAQGHPEATYCMAMAYLHGWGIERDPAKALTAFQWCAERGDRDAAYWLFTLYEFGEVDIREDKAESARWLRRAGELGDPEAQYQLGLTPPPDCEGGPWLEKAEAQGHAAAQSLIEELASASDVSM